MNKIPTTPPDIAESDAKLTLLIKWMGWFSRAMLIVGVFFFAVFAIRKSPASLIFAIIFTLICYPASLYGLKTARQGRAKPAIYIIISVCWSLALAIASRGATTLPAALPMLLIPMIIALPYASSAELLKIAIGALVVCTGAVALTLHGSFLPSSLEEATLALIMLPNIILVTGLATFGLWHVGTRMRRVLAETEVMNKALAESERSLEQKVAVRTEELEDAIEEISDIQEIAHTVNTTLDLDQVIQAMRNALLRTFHFDQLSVFLLSEDRQYLRIDRMAGVELSEDIQTRVLQEGIPMSEESSILVSAVLEGKPRWATDLAPDSVEAMSPSDRWMFELNPMKSLLVCPLQIKGATIGAVVFGNTRKSVDVGAEELNRIKRYVTPLSTMIRNANLFQEAQKARADAIESSKAKSQFLANMSHELRTPLNAIIGYSEMLSEQAEEDDKREYADDLEKIRKSGIFLLELISGVLDLTKIESGKLEVNMSRFDVGDLLSEVVMASQPQVKKNSNRLEESKFEHLGEMNSDLTKVRQILLNLLSNAAKFTEQGMIRLDAARTSRDDVEWLTFKVTDNGIGMSPEQLEHVFNAFTQADSSTSRKYGGTGLGLTISKEFCEMLGGNISVESNPGQGSVFTLKLPVEAPGN